MTLRRSMVSSSTIALSVPVLLFHVMVYKTGFPCWSYSRGRTLNEKFKQHNISIPENEVACPCGELPPIYLTA
ncbi:hypothetical protein B0F90DRAFT_1752673 [Multifurca ochricompacta]|uniref:Uncharacterized protein n=1 Tax=Multifurca ochricompacta TaxID=376703 RepID=A0AAD4QHZ7_9AGAM|nr:hypothetical protein B0F90DRAFT_1752673 [Multifurca ochricompacta]